VSEKPLLDDGKECNFREKLEKAYGMEHVANLGLITNA
jgi:hypothetical protein